MEKNKYLDDFSNEIDNVDNQMSLSCGQGEPNSRSKNVFFNCNRCLLCFLLFWSPCILPILTDVKTNEILVNENSQFLIQLFLCDIESSSLVHKFLNLLWNFFLSIDKNFLFFIIKFEIILSFIFFI